MLKLTQNFTKNHSIHKHGPEVEAHHCRQGKHKSKATVKCTASNSNMTHMYKILSTPAWRWKACTSNPYRTGLIHLYSVSSNRAEQQEQIVTWREERGEEKKKVQNAHLCIMLSCESLRFDIYQDHSTNHTQDIAEYLWDSGLHYTQSTKPLQSSLCLAACSQRNPFAEGGGGERLIVSASTNHVLSSAALTIHLQHNIALK